MKLKTALEGIGKFDATSEKRLRQYQAKLSRSKDETVFDDRVRDYLQQISLQGNTLVTRVNNKLDEMGWNQSTYKPDAIVEQAKRFTLPDRPNRAYRRYFSKVKAKLIGDISKAKLKMIDYISQQDIVNTLPRLDTHAGYSSLTTGAFKKGDYIEGLLDAYLYEEAQARINNSFNKPILIGSRTQGKAPYDVRTGEFADNLAQDVDKLKKTRLVSMIDIYQIIAECRFAVPFQQYLSKLDWYAGGKNDSWIRNEVYLSRGRFFYWTSVDYSCYDQTIPAWLIREAFDVVRSAFIQDSFDEQLFSIIREDFIHKVFILSDEIIEAHKGVPSGSMFTQIIDSVVNYLMIASYLEKEDGFDRYRMFIMGDDNLIFTTKRIDEHDMSSYLFNEFGIVMNPEKADLGDRFTDPIFLSRIWTEHGPYRTPEIIVAKLLYPESRREYDKYGFTPSMVVQSYFDSFRLGMDKAFSKPLHDNKSQEEKKAISAGKWLSGLQRYNLLYGSKT